MRNADAGSSHTSIGRRVNVGSTARDHLANERTYLAWLRTGIGTVALGLGVAHFLGRSGDWAPLVGGAVFLALGVGMVSYGTLRYYRVQRALDQGQIRLSRTGPVNIGLVSGGLTLLVVLLLLFS